MATAISRIKTGRGQFIKPGEDVPSDVAEANPHVVSSRDFKPSYDPAKPESLEGEEAARDSVLMRPDNPDRPASVEGEASWKVTGGGALGKSTPGPIAPKGAAKPERRTGAQTGAERLPNTGNQAPPPTQNEKP